VHNHAAEPPRRAAEVEAVREGKALVDLEKQARQSAKERMEKRRTSERTTK
jgi:hypothetical protein